ncbi:hypothetical protein Q2T40_02615 [Winogradskyella maritima]|nr:hypothetical protein [Winogradskyella maritima]
MVVYGAQTPVNATADSLYMLGDYTKAINEYAKIEGGVAGFKLQEATMPLVIMKKLLFNMKVLLQQIQPTSWPCLNLVSFF